MCLHDLDEGTVTPPPCAASVPIPPDLAKAIDKELKASYELLEDSKTGASGSPKRPDGGMGDPCSEVAVRSPMAQVCAPDTHNQTLCATRVRKDPHTTSAAVVATDVSASTKQMLANTAAIR